MSKKAGKNQKGSSPSPSDLARIRSDLHPLVVSIDRLSKDPENARTHPEENLAAVRSSLAAFGQVLPLVARRKDGRVLAGNGRLAVMQQEGWRFVAVIFTEDDDALARAYSRTDNRTAELATWDDARLASALAALDDAGRAATGFSGKRLDELLAIASNTVKPPSPPKEFAKFDESVPINHVCPGCGYRWS